jgi:hypothetical protein
MRTRPLRILAQTGISVALTLTLLLAGALLWSILATPTARASHSSLSPAACTPGPHLLAEIAAAGQSAAYWRRHPTGAGHAAVTG